MQRRLRFVTNGMLHLSSLAVDRHRMPRERDEEEKSEKSRPSRQIPFFGLTLGKHKHMTYARLLWHRVNRCPLFSLLLNNHCPIPEWPLAQQTPAPKKVHGVKTNQRYPDPMALYPESERKSDFPEALTSLLSGPVTDVSPRKKKPSGFIDDHKRGPRTEKRKQVTFISRKDFQYPHEILDWTVVDLVLVLACSPMAGRSEDTTK